MMSASDFDFVWGSYDQCRAKLIGFNFLYTFQLKGMKFGIVIMQFILHILVLILSEIC